MAILLYALFLYDHGWGRTLHRKTACHVRHGQFNADKCRNGNNKMKNSEIALERYRRLIAHVEAYEAALYAKYAPHIACTAGCDSCCILESVCAIEGFRMHEALRASGPAILSLVAGNRDRADGRCVLLLDGRCLLYAHRPIICRTHGYPLLIEGRVDFCRRNFTELSTIDSENIISLDALNEALARINILFMEEVDDARFRTDRLFLRELIAPMS